MTKIKPAAQKEYSREELIHLIIEAIRDKKGNEIVNIEIGRAHV